MRIIKRVKCVVGGELGVEVGVPGEVRRLGSTKKIGTHSAASATVSKIWTRTAGCPDIRSSFRKRTDAYLCASQLQEKVGPQGIARN